MLSAVLLVTWLSLTNNNKEADQRMVFPGELGVYVDNIAFQRIGYSMDDRSKRT
ncbi:unnamed protein product [Musa acuminata subsp. malaccensis]|uniref:(wild Malaysian banana) hypothetical protein n=1 Tax=Musa acuminata subsp. malaccensis TaxID=214687 RepID=A0A804JQD3_MUSAM|nr:unnamed protein product [Musa acuminata subsp. malaccensis]